MRFNELESRRAFTLTEILVSIGVLGILLVLVAGAIKYVNIAGHRVRCAANLRQAATGFTGFMTDYRGAFPAADAWYNYSYDNSGAGMREYMNVSTDPNAPKVDTIWSCPALQRDPETRAADNAAFHRTYTLNLCATTGHKRYSLTNISAVPNPSRMITFLDGSIQTRRRNANVYHISHGYDVYPERFTEPHGGTLNMVFLDGHVESMSVEQMLNPDQLAMRWKGQ